MSRLIIPIEFNKNKQDEVELYHYLKSFSNPNSIIKDILKGKIPVSILNIDKNNK
ncbi:TPA: hypothetical protein ACF2DD_002052 [Clostridium perfringens]|nr:hypothetical protein [Clostridium perfringens]